MKMLCSMRVSLKYLIWADFMRKIFRIRKSISMGRWNTTMRSVRMVPPTPRAKLIRVVLLFKGPCLIDMRLVSRCRCTRFHRTKVITTQKITSPLEIFVPTSEWCRLAREWRSIMKILRTPMSNLPLSICRLIRLLVMIIKTEAINPL